MIGRLFNPCTSEVPSDHTLREESDSATIQGVFVPSSLGAGLLLRKLSDGTFEGMLIVQMVGSDGPSDVKRDAVMGTGTTASDSQEKYQAAF